MDLRQAVRIWRTRWTLTSVLLILALAGIGGATAEMPRYYQSDSSMVLLASRAASMQNGGNPFLSFSPSLTLTADAVSRALMAPQTVRQLAGQGFTASYTVALPTYTTSTTGSVLLVTVTGADAAGVQRTLQAVNTQIGTQLAQLQNGVPPRGQVHADTLSSTPQATLSISQTARPLVVVGVLLLVIALGTPIVVDGLITRRRLRKRSVFPDHPALSSDWALLDIPTFPRESPFPEEQTLPGGATGRAIEQVDDDPAPGDSWLPSSSWPPARNNGPSRRHARRDGAEG
jgi:hypothetical protein